MNKMEPYKHKIQVYETDNMGITHHSNYVRFMEEARVDFMERSGYGYERMIEEGVVSPVVAINCEYKRPTSYPQVIEIEVKVLEMSALKVKIGYTMTCAGKVVCTANSTHCFLDAKTNRPVALKERFPELHAIFEAALV